MTDMKCPFCQKELKHEKTTGTYCCPTIFIDCPLGLGTGAFGTKELWQELIRTRKALDLAFEMLKDIKNDPDTNNELTQEIADRLSEIKTLTERDEE